MKALDFIKLPFEFKSNPLAYSLLLTHIHFFLVLYLLDLSPMGRYKLAKELLLTPALTRTFLNKLQQRGLLQVTTRRHGHRLTEMGKEILQKYKKRFVPINERETIEEIVIGKVAYIIILRKKYFRPNLRVLELRDQAIRQQALGATVLEISKEGLVFAQSSPSDPYYRAKVSEHVEKLIYFQNPQVGDWCLLVGADNFYLARQAGIRAALFATSCEEVLQAISSRLGPCC